MKNWRLVVDFSLLVIVILFWIFGSLMYKWLECVLCWMLGCVILNWLICFSMICLIFVMELDSLLWKNEIILLLEELWFNLEIFLILRFLMIKWFLFMCLYLEWNVLMKLIFWWLCRFSVVLKGCLKVRLCWLCV